jgi:predicted HTH transcriptional regulator
MREHLQLEYKSSSYEQNENGRREFLQDICMFANAAGGVLLIGVTESRGDDGQPSGAPDPDAALGVASPNPDAVLLASDAQIVACIEDRLAVEAYPIPVGEGRFVFAFRVPSSVRKPHCVRIQHRKYFPARRERNRYEMDLREIKEQTLRAASQLERAQQLIQRELNDLEATQLPHLFVTQVPVFSRDFSVDITQEGIVQQIQRFDVRTG